MPIGRREQYSLDWNLEKTWTDRSTSDITKYLPWFRTEAQKSKKELHQYQPAGTGTLLILRKPRFLKCFLSSLAQIAFQEKFCMNANLSELACYTNLYQKCSVQSRRQNMYSLSKKLENNFLAETVLPDQVAPFLNVWTAFVLINREVQIFRVQSYFEMLMWKVLDVRIEWLIWTRHLPVLGLVFFSRVQSCFRRFPEESRRTFSCLDTMSRFFRLL